MKQLTVQQATHQLDTLIDAAMSGEVVVLTRDDRPAVRLVPVSSSSGRPQHGSAKGKVRPGATMRRDPRRRSAFTLVELLVVIGIIAMLISILLPALGRRGGCIPE